MIPEPPKTVIQKPRLIPEPPKAVIQQPNPIPTPDNPVFQQPKRRPDQLRASKFKFRDLHLYLTEIKNSHYDLTFNDESYRVHFVDIQHFTRNGNILMLVQHLMKQCLDGKLTQYTLTGQRQLKTRSDGRSTKVKDAAKIFPEELKQNIKQFVLDTQILMNHPELLDIFDSYMNTIFTKAFNREQDKERKQREAAAKRTQNYLKTLEPVTILDRNETVSNDPTPKDVEQENISDDGDLEMSIKVENIDPLDIKQEPMDFDFAEECNKTQKKSPKVKTKGPKKRFICEQCNKAFWAKKALEIHVAEKHKDLKSLECPYCNKSCKSQTTLDYHVASTHQSQENTKYNSMIRQKNPIKSYSDE